MLLTFKDDNMTGSFSHLSHMFSVVIVSDYICVRVHLYTITICVDGMNMDMWLCLVLVVIGWAYFTYDMSLCGYYVITDIFVSF